MINKLRYIGMWIVVSVFTALTAFAMFVPQNVKTGQGQPQQARAGQPQGQRGKDDKNGDSNVTNANKTQRAKGDTTKIHDLSDVILIEDTDIPDSLIHPRWQIQRTTPITVSDLDQNSADLQRPENIKQEMEYNDTYDTYLFGNRLGGTFIEAPVSMTLEEYLLYLDRKQRAEYYKTKNAEAVAAKGKDKFDFTDMHFDLGPAEKIFGPGGVRIKTQGTAELKFGATLKNIDNPSLPIRNRKTTTMDFDEKINVNVTGKVGDKVNMGLNYNTDATFDFDQQNIKLKYDGKEDEIIKLLEAGNVSFPGNSSLIKGASSLFGIRADMQFGKLKLQTVVSQKKSNTSSASSKGGTQFTPFEIDVANYEENRHFFLADYFRTIYDKGMSQLPNVTTGIKINKVEIWVTNKNASTTNVRNILALTDLGETKPSKSRWGGTGMTGIPANDVNGEYNEVKGLSGVRDIDQVSSALDGDQLEGGIDYEKLESARLLSSSEYTVNEALGYVSLKTTLQTDQVLAIAYEYTYNGQVYKVGELTSDPNEELNNTSMLIVKSLKNTANSPQQGNWRLMMKNVYYLASTVEKEKFRLDVKFQSDTAGVYLSYIPEQQVKGTPLIRLLGADRLDSNNKTHANGYFDFVEGYTVTNGRVFFPAAEPFGSYMHDVLVKNGVADDIAKKYAYTELYDSTKTVAKQIAEKDKYILSGQFKGSASNVISLGAYNIPRGSVTVTAGSQVLTEGSDYTVDYSAGEVTILNQSIIDAGTSVNASYESNTDYGQQRKTMLGLNWEYDFSKDFQISGTIQHLSEQSLTTKVTMGSEPLNNTLWGFNINWKKESQWLTNLLDKLPGLHLTAPSSIQFSAEFAQLLAGTASGTQDNASYLDDFENTKSTIDVSTPTSWMISSVPSNFPESTDKTTLASGYNRALLAWYNIDPLFTRRSSSYTPSTIKGNTNVLSNHYEREVYVSELFPNRDQSSYNGATNTLSILNLAYYPDERGPYNFTTDLDPTTGRLKYPSRSWGGMMRKLDTPDFETANVEYIEFWLLDPFISGRNGYKDTNGMGADLYIDLGEVSEDVLHDGKKFFEDGMPVSDTQTETTITESQWGKIPTKLVSKDYAFSTASGTRKKQDVGLDGLTDEEEQTFTSYKTFLDFVKTLPSDVSASILADPSADNYKYFRGSDWDEMESMQNPDSISILTRYKHINGLQGNSPDSEDRTESYDTSYKTTPDVEDINQDFTLNEYEKYFQYHVAITPDQMKVGQNFIVDKREASPTLRNGDNDKVTWYQFRIPLREFTGSKGSISDFTSIRFMRMFLTNASRPIVLRFGTLDLVRGEWRIYDQNLNTSSANTGTMAVSAVNIEENNDKTPVNYVLPPGISRVVDPSQPQLTENNEQALALTFKNMSNGDAKCVYKNSTTDLRSYKHLQMFVHANALENDVTNLKDNQLALFVRLGSDYKTNYYEYQIPLKLTPAGHYDTYSSSGCEAVWPTENMLNIDLSLFTKLKKERNVKKASGEASYNKVYTAYDSDNPANMISIIGNPSLGEVKTMIIGVRNISPDVKSGEVWVNELRLKDASNEGGWAAQGNLNVQLSDLGTVNMAGKYTTSGFGGLEEGVTQRSTDNYANFQATMNFELGKFFPDKAKVNLPIYYSITKERTSPKYNPLDTDMELKDALDAAANKQERDSIESIAVTKVLQTNFSISNAKIGIATKGHPMPYDPANFSFTYAHQHSHKSGETTVYENSDTWDGGLSYSWSPVYKSFEPFKKLKSKSKYLDIFKKFGLNWLPQTIAFNTKMTRLYEETQERDLESTEGTSIPLTFNESFLWNRDFTLRWDLTKNIHFNFQSATHAEVEEPYTPVNKDLYPDRYSAWKDSVWTSIKHLGSPLDYSQNVTASYKLPLNLIPIFDWLTADANYSSTYNWQRGTDLDDGTSLGNTIAMNRTVTFNGSLAMEKLYSHIPFLKKVNEKYNKTQTSTKKKETKDKDKKDKNTKGKDASDKSDASGKSGESGKSGKSGASGKDAKSQLPLNKNSVQKELTLYPDSAVEFAHNKKSKRLIVTAKTADGKLINVKYKKKDDNKIALRLRGDSAMKVKVTVTKKPDLEEKAWYRAAQFTARLLMMVRNINITYKNAYQMSLPGFKNNVGAAFGQKSVGGLMSPGLDFAFGAVSDSWIDKASDRGWLIKDSTVATPATTNKTEDLQIRVTLEPFKNFKIDLNASRYLTRGKSVQYMYDGNPTTMSGTFNMTTISIGSAFEGIGNDNNGFHSSSFEKFCNSLATYKELVDARFPSHRSGDTDAKGRAYSTTGVGQYSADVMVPAFVNAYTSMSGKSLSLFPAISRMLPNWSLKFSGLGQLPWIRDHFKSVNLSHAYKSIYSIGSYSSYTSYLEYMGDIGYVISSSNELIPSSMYDISQVSINEAFSPLLGLDFTLNNGMTFKVEYKTVRTLNLSMTSVQLTEQTSKDWVVGMGYKIQDFKLFSGGSRKIKVSSKNKKGNGADDDKSKSSTNTKSKTTKKGEISHDLNLRLDLSLRKQAAINRDIRTITSTATSGNNAFKLSFTADYTLSRLLTMSFYLDRQTNTPLLSNNSYPTTTQDFGLSLKFSLTR